MDADDLDRCLPRVSLSAPAKLNLGLRIVGRRDDGYHLLESLFWPIDLADSLVLERASGLSLDASWAEDAPSRSREIPPAEKNLVFKTLARLPGGKGDGWRVKLSKRIPMGAGLGGGSSDAGALLRYFRNHGISDGEIAALAPALGADVPFFLDPVPTWVSGIGEKRRPIALDPSLTPSLAFLLVLLPEGVETKTVFGRYRAAGSAFSPTTDFPSETLRPSGLRDFLSLAGNDLETAASQQYPLIARVLAELRRAHSLYAGLSGTGSTCFAVFPGIDAPKKISKALLPFCREYNCRLFTAQTYTLS